MSEDSAPDITALALRQAGLPPGVIANRLDRSEREISEELHRVLQDKSEGFLTDDTLLEISRLEELNRKQWVNALAGDQDSISSVLALQKRRRELLAQAASLRPTPAQDLNNSVAELLRKVTARHA